MKHGDGPKYANGGLALIERGDEFRFLGMDEGPWKSTSVWRLDSFRTWMMGKR